MGWLAWLNRNWADTDEPGSSVSAFDLTATPAEVLASIEAWIQKTPSWQVVSMDRAAGLLQATRTTRLWRFVDDISLRLETTPTGTRVHGRSQSRVGQGDFGQNRRNLLQLFSALQN